MPNCGLPSKAKQKQLKAGPLIAAYT
jgi:hypothetical protein